MKYECKSCGSVLSVSEEMAGGLLRCSVCGDMDWYEVKKKYWECNGCDDGPCFRDLEAKPTKCNVSGEPMVLPHDWREVKEKPNEPREEVECDSEGPYLLKWDEGGGCYHQPYECPGCKERDKEIIGLDAERHRLSKCFDDGCALNRRHVAEKSQLNYQIRQLNRELAADPSLLLKGKINHMEAEIEDKDKKIEELHDAIKLLQNLDKMKDKRHGEEVARLGKVIDLRDAEIHRINKENRQHVDNSLAFVKQREARRAEIVGLISKAEGLEEDIEELTGKYKRRGDLLLDANKEIGRLSTYEPKLTEILKLLKAKKRK